MPEIGVGGWEMLDFKILITNPGCFFPSRHNSCNINNFHIITYTPPFLPSRPKNMYIVFCVALSIYTHTRTIKRRFWASPPGVWKCSCRALTSGPLGVVEQENWPNPDFGNHAVLFMIMVWITFQDGLWIARQLAETPAGPRWASKVLWRKFVSISPPRQGSGRTFTKNYAEWEEREANSSPPPSNKKPCQNLLVDFIRDVWLWTFQYGYLNHLDVLGVVDFCFKKSPGFHRINLVSEPQ